MTRKINFRSVRTATLIGVGALAAGLAVAVPLTSHDAHADHANRSPVAAPIGPSPQPGTDGPITLVSGARWADGLSLRYPDNHSGALSAGLEFTTALFEALDPDRLRAIKHDISAPGERIGPDPETMARDDRALIGAPATGPLPPGTALVLTGRMYQLLDFDEHQAHLLLMFTLMASGPNAPDLSGKFLALPVQLSWAAGDWKLTWWDHGSSYDSRAAAPDSTAAYDNGWLGLPSASDGPGSWS